MSDGHNKFIPSYSDSRFLDNCAFCGRGTETRDHCPSRIFLDEPYPPDLPVVPACRNCNNGFSIDEEYLACLISCVLAGDCEPENIERSKISRILRERKGLKERLEQVRQSNTDGTLFMPEMERTKTVVVKLAQGHALHELGESQHNDPNQVVIRPLSLLTEEERNWFEHPPGANIWPEVGSRAMQRMALHGGLSPWIDIQPGRYRYHARADAAVEIRIVLHEYLAAYCCWGG